MQTFSRIQHSFFGFVLGILLLLPIVTEPMGCKGEGTPHTSGNGGAGGMGGCPVRLPEPQFILEIRAEEGPVPKDTKVSAQWSAAEEPPFVLSDPATWKTLDDSVNLVCMVDRTKPPPEDLSVLICELWTSGPVNLVVEATGYVAHEETLKPVMDEFCKEPMTATMPVVLHRPLPDGGPLP